MLWFIFVLFASAYAACPEEQTKVLYPSEGIGHLKCTGRCKKVSNISCVGIRVDTDNCYRWTCHHIPKSYAGYVTMDIPSPYDTIHIDVASAPAGRAIALFVIMVFMCLIYPSQFLFGVLSGAFLSSFDDDEMAYRFES